MPAAKSRNRFVMLIVRKGRYLARFAGTEDDLRACVDLRGRAFRAGVRGGSDADGFDAICRHVMVEAGQTGRLVCCFRLFPLADGREIGRTYAAQFYELSALRTYPGRMVELGRFCIDPTLRDPDILRAAWGAMTRFVDAEGVEMLFGCSSFAGTDPEGYLDAFAMLKDAHLAPKRWLPRIKAPRVFRFARALRLRKPDVRAAMMAMPPLLRTYLAMGGWVSDHAVVDADLGTLHVFTGLEIGRIPAARARLLRAATA
jgi:L-ornithine Nalpha-acyltransferase